jgi:hypothetical protein
MPISPRAKPRDRRCCWFEIGAAFKAFNMNAGIGGAGALAYPLKLIARSIIRMLA